VSAIESSFDHYREELANMLKKIDVDLAMRVMYLERRLPDVEPHVELDAKIKDGVDRLMLSYEINSRFGFQTSIQNDHLILVGRAKMDDIFSLSQNPSIEFISGNATAASY